MQNVSCKIINVKFINKRNVQNMRYRMSSALISAAGWQRASFRVHEIIISLVYNKGRCIHRNYAFGPSLFKLYRNSNVCYKMPLFKSTSVFRLFNKQKQEQPEFNLI